VGGNAALFSENLEKIYENAGIKRQEILRSSVRSYPVQRGSTFVGTPAISMADSSQFKGFLQWSGNIWFIVFWVDLMLYRF
jgi:hypothetical protein